MDVSAAQNLNNNVARTKTTEAVAASGTPGPINEVVVTALEAARTTLDELLNSLSNQVPADVTTLVPEAVAFALEFVPGVLRGIVTGVADAVVKGAEPALTKAAQVGIGIALARIDATIEAAKARFGKQPVTPPAE